MPYQYLLYEKQRQGVLITLNRPEQLNAFNDGLRLSEEINIDISPIICLYFVTILG